MTDPKPGPYTTHDYERPRGEKDHLPGDHINHSSTFWRDDDGVQHRESYNYDENGNMENLHSDRGSGPSDR